MSAIQNLLGWTEVQLSEISYRITKGTTPTSVGFNFTENGILFVKVESLSEQRINHNLCAFISSEADEALARSRFKENDILFSIAGTLGRIAIVQAEDLPANTNQAICIIRLIPPIFPKYIAQILSSHLLEDRIKEQRRGVGLQNLNLRQVSEFTIPLPPLNEQKRIVAKIEALQERSQRVKAELVAIRPLLNKFRQSVLAAAFRGDLTKDWREKNPDIEPASVLLERIKIEQEIWYEKGCQKAVDAGRRKPLNPKKNKKSDKQIFVIDNVPDTWKVIRLEDISYLVTDGTHKTPKYQEQGIPFLSVKNVRPFKVYDEDIKFVSQEEYEVINSRCNPEKGDILYTKVGATFGYAAINNLSYDFSIFVSLALIKPVNPYFSSEYAEAVMNSPIVYSQAKERVSGIGTPDLHLIEIRDFKIPLPPIEEQKEIVNRIDKLFKIADNIEHQYQKTETDLETLNQSILAKAFRGELVPQNPNDEPASVLLERIRKERETDSKPAKQTRQKPPKTDNNNSTQLTLEGIE